VSAKFIWRISVTTSAEAEEAVTELVAEVCGQSASSFFHVETRRVVVSTYFAKKPTGVPVMLAALRKGLSNIRDCGLDAAPGKVTSTRIPRESWAHSWKKHFKPLEIGSALLIKPSWVRRKARAGQAMVILDPGLSFGTGQHATTEFCLRQIVKRTNAKRKSQNGKLSLLDIGTGSGILAIAAAKLGYAPVEAFDFDPESGRVATANARKNGVAKRIGISHKDLKRMPRRSARRFDVVCANLISTLLIAECGRIIARLKPEGVLVLAGILAKEFGEVEKVYGKCGLKLVASKVQKEWRSGAFVMINKP
jgi:ribosomal protein L11 methyltransferase